MAGDDPDFLESFAGEFWPLRRVGFLLTGDWDQAEELAQEAMARTYAVWPRVRGYDRPAAYARKVLLNRHRSLLRRAVVEARHLVASRPDDRHQPNFGGDDLVLWQALRRLPARQREAIVLRYYLDLPEAEVARLLKVPRARSSPGPTVACPACATASDPPTPTSASPATAPRRPAHDHRGPGPPHPGRRRRRRAPAPRGPLHAALRRSDQAIPPATPTLTTLPTAGWPEVTDDAGNFRFRYPPGWEARRIGDQWVLAPRGIPRNDPGRAGLRGEGHVRPQPVEVPRVLAGHHPGGRATARRPGLPAHLARPGAVRHLLRRLGPRLRQARRSRQLPASQRPGRVPLVHRKTPWDRYQAEVQTVVSTLEKLRPTAPTVGDRSRPACRAGQWELVPPDVTVTDQGHPVGVGFRGGRPCHLRAPVSMAALQDGRLVEVRGNPAPATIELDLPEDALPATYRGSDEDRMLQIWVWDRPCKSPRPPSRPVTFRRVDLVFSDERGRRLLATHFNQGPETGVCGDRGQPSVLASWP
jgi:RNA polymerase sigma factor (sigma-70 family)